MKAIPSSKIASLNRAFQAVLPRRRRPKSRGYSEAGPLEPGKLADLIMVSPDIFEIDPHKIAETRVLLMMVGGKIIYDAR
jgi:predicted amidohydrolase YtcJ